MIDLGVVTVHIPPKYNLNNRRQVWFVELENPTVTNLINGALTATVLMAVIIGSIHIGKVI